MKLFFDSFNLISFLHNSYCNTKSKVPNKRVDIISMYPSPVSTISISVFPGKNSLINSPIILAP